MNAKRELIIAIATHGVQTHLGLSGAHVIQASWAMADHAQVRHFTSSLRLVMSHDRAPLEHTFRPEVL